MFSAGRHEGNKTSIWCILNEVTSLQGNFNKLKMLQKVLNDTPPVSAGGVSWLWWLDIDTVLDPAQVRVFSAVRHLCSSAHAVSPALCRG